MAKGKRKNTGASGQQVVPRSQQRQGQLTRADILQISQYSGPLPPPEALKAYDEIHPGGAEKIFDAFEKQNNHRIKSERKFFFRDHMQITVGQLLGCALVAYVVYLGYLLIMAGHELPGTVLSGGGLATLATAFLKHRNRE